MPSDRVNAEPVVAAVAVKSAAGTSLPVSAGAADDEVAGEVVASDGHAAAADGRSRTRNAAAAIQERNQLGFGVEGAGIVAGAGGEGRGDGRAAAELEGQRVAVGKIGEAGRV